MAARNDPGTTGQGVYSTYGGLHVVADTTTPVPGGTGTFRVLSDAVFAGPGFTIFSGDDQNYHGGVFIESGGVIQKILDGSVNFLNGHMVLNAGYSIANVDGNQFAFAATEPGGGFSVWLAQVTPVPIPAAVWLLGSALGMLGWIGRKTVA